MANNSDSMSIKIAVIVGIGIAFLAGYLVSRARYKPQIADLSTMVIERDDKIATLNNLRNRIVFRNNELSQIKDGEKIVFEDAVLLTDGTKVTVKGEVLRTDGEKEKLNEGDTIFMDGTLMSEDDLSEIMMKMNEKN